jgi:hypothetical protein
VGGTTMGAFGIVGSKIGATVDFGSAATIVIGNLGSSGARADVVDRCRHCPARHQRGHLAHGAVAGEPRMTDPQLIDIGGVAAV